jgi:hypothetical protein
MPNRIPTPGIPTPQVRRSSGSQPAAKVRESAVLKGDAAVKAYRKEISPSGMASAKAAQSKAMDKKYPGLYKKAK